MPCVEEQAKTITRKMKRIDSWFLGRYSMNLYRGCTHGCSYCDGRAETYRVEGDFGRDVTVKTNALEILERELDPARKRKPFAGGYFMPGGGVGDSYQPAEQKYRLTRGALTLMEHFGHPVHVLTKSLLVKDDLGLFLAIQKKAPVVVSFSFSSIDEGLAKIFEPGVPPPEDRLQCIKDLTAAGIPCGVYYMPVIPSVTDSTAMMKDSLRAFQEAGASFAVFSGMTLKEGRQMDHFNEVLEKHFPGKGALYKKIYRGDYRGGTTTQYYRELNRRYLAASEHISLPKRMPPELYNDIVNLHEKIIVILDHLEFFRKLHGERSSFGYTAHIVSKLKEELSPGRDVSALLPNMKSEVIDVIEEIMETGSCEMYRRYFGRD